MVDLPPLLKAALQLQAETDISRLFLPATSSTNLSPAAQAVLDAVVSQPSINTRNRAAAALRAAAELLSQEVEAPKVDGSKYAGLWHSHDYLNAIAAELEGMK